MAKKIYEQYVEQRAEALRKRLAPVEVLFSSKGHIQALSQDDGSGNRLNLQTKGWPTEYMGLPFRIVHDQVEPIKLRCVDGGSAEAHLFRSSRRAADQQIAGHNTARAKMMLENEETLKLLGKVITEAQLSDLIVAFAEDAIMSGANTPFQAAVYQAVVNYGRFE